MRTGVKHSWWVLWAPDPAACPEPLWAIAQERNGREGSAFPSAPAPPPDASGKGQRWFQGHNPKPSHEDYWNRGLCRDEDFDKVTFHVEKNQGNFGCLSTAENSEVIPLYKPCKRRVWPLSHPLTFTATEEEQVKSKFCGLRVVDKSVVPVGPASQLPCTHRGAWT